MNVYLIKLATKLLMPASSQLRNIQGNTSGWSSQPEEQMIGRELIQLPKNKINTRYFHSIKLDTWKILKTVDNTMPPTEVFM